jgi:hypothetical protein
MSVTDKALLFGCLLLAGCASSKYVEHYTPEPGVTALGPTTQVATIKPSMDLDADVQRRLAQGYVVLGRSDFTATLQDDQGIYQQASTVGATLVLKKNTFLRTESVDRTVYTPNSTTDNTTVVGRGSSRANAPDPTDPMAARRGSISHVEQQGLYRHQAVFLAE